MKVEEVIKLLQHNRHDLMNQIQVIKGYLSMDKKAEVNQKIDNLIENSNKERRLMNFSIPEYSLWVVMFNSTHENIRLTYDLDIINGSLNHIDKFLVSKSDELLVIIENYMDKSILYDLTFELSATDKSIQLNYNLSGYIKKQTNLVKALNKIAPTHIKSNEKINIKIDFEK